MNEYVILLNNKHMATLRVQPDTLYKKQLSCHEKSKQKNSIDSLICLKQLYHPVCNYTMTAAADGSEHIKNKCLVILFVFGMNN